MGQKSVKKSVLVINCGASSVKLGWYFLTQKNLLVHKELEIKKLFSPNPIFMTDNTPKKISKIQDHKKGLLLLIEKCIKLGLEAQSLCAIGHRIVHGGGIFHKPTRITPSVVQKLKKIASLAPLHNPPAMAGIAMMKKYFGPILQVAVFDTAFHASMPEKNVYYPIPISISKKYGIRKYGFHGLAHEGALYLYSDFTGKSRKQANIVTVHLGSGCSLCAIKGGCSVDTTMGFTPLEGVMMATRSGSLDPNIVRFLSQKMGQSIVSVMSILTEQSGLLGISGKTADLEEIIQKRKQQKQYALAFEMFADTIVKAIGAYMAILEQVQAIVFSGGIGENAFVLRESVLKKFKSQGILLDKQKNRIGFGNQKKEIIAIHDSASSIQVYVAKVDENQLIARKIKNTLL